MATTKEETTAPGEAGLYALCFYVPASHADTVKDAVFGAGAGRIGNYDRCSWETSGCGQFRPLAGSQPFTGDVGSVETVQELRVEMVCEAACLDAVIRALVDSHPYETPAYHFWAVNQRPGG